MARKKSIVDIQVNDKKFKEFQGQYNKFLESLEKMPRGWDKLDKSIGKSQETLRNTTAALLAQQAAFRSQDKEETRKQNTALRKAREARSEKAQADRAERESKRKVEKEDKERQRQVLDIERKRKAETRQVLNDTKSIGKVVAQTTVNLFKWVGIGEALTGLVGFGSLWGVADLAGRATDMRRAALALGTTAPGQEAANIFLSPFTNVNQSLGGIAAAKADRSKWWAQSFTGVPFASMDPTQALLKLLPAAWSRVQGRTLTEQDPTVMAFEAAGLSIETLRSLQGISRSELDQAIQGTAKGMKSLNQELGTSNLMAWTNLQVALHNAGVQIEAVLINGLSPLADALPKLTDSVVQAVKDFFATHDIKDLIKEFGASIQDLGDYIGSPKFKQSVKGLVDDLPPLAAGIHNLLELVGLVPPVAGPKGAAKPGVGGSRTDPGGYYTYDLFGRPHWRKPDKPMFGSPSLVLGGIAGGAGPPLQMGMQLGLANTLVGYLTKNGVAKSTAQGIAAGAFAEGGFSGRNNPNSGAFGLGQWLGSRQKALFARYGANPSFEQQMQFLLSELRGGDRGGSSVLGSGDPMEAMYNYITKFMRPAAGYETNRDLRSGAGVLPTLSHMKVQPITVGAHIIVTAAAGSSVAVQGAQLSGASR